MYQLIYVKHVIAWVFVCPNLIVFYKITFCRKLLGVKNYGN